MAERTIRVDQIARVEGEGALTIRLRDDRPAEVELRIFEPPRFFEALLVGRAQEEAPDITSRICGICPVAYLMSACHAIEAAHGVRLDGTLRALRRLLYCGEWISSHVLHVFLLHLPDFLGYPDAVRMAKDHRDLVQRGLRLKKAGNALMSLLGGREIHPVNVRVGGFYRAPTRTDLEALLPELRWGRDAASETFAFLASLPFPAFDRDRELVALRHPDEYAICEGRLASTRGLDIAVEEWDAHFAEEHVPRSTALHARLRERGAYLCGPLARVNLSFEQLSPRALDAARAAGFAPPCTNPFKSLLARGLEVIHAFDEAVRIVEAYREPAASSVAVPAREGIGHACTEAPRGSLYHRYAVDERGLITSARIIPPTSQNQRAIEEDLFALAPQLLEVSHREATLLAEKAVRSYDPCISCATHFLTLRVEHGA